MSLVELVVSSRFLCILDQSLCIALERLLVVYSLFKYLYHIIKVLIFKEMKICEITNISQNFPSLCAVAKVKNKTDKSCKEDTVSFINFFPIHMSQNI